MARPTASPTWRPEPSPTWRPESSSTQYPCRNDKYVHDSERSVALATGRSLLCQGLNCSNASAVARHRSPPPLAGVCSLIWRSRLVGLSFLESFVYVGSGRRYSNDPDVISTRTTRKGTGLRFGQGCQGRSGLSGGKPGGMPGEVGPVRGEARGKVGPVRGGLERSGLADLLGVRCASRLEDRCA